LSVVTLPPTAAAQERPVPKKDFLAEPTHWGNVAGRVYDAETGAPIAKATVSIQGENGDFLEKGRTFSTTDLLGTYQASAVLGRVSQNFDVGRAIGSSFVGLLFGGAVNTTRRVDVTRLNLRVSAPGYKPYLGPVPAREIEPRAFRVNMQPILLVPQSSATESTGANGWGMVRIESVETQPAVARPDQTVRIVAKVFAQGDQLDKSLQLKATSRLWRGERSLRPLPGAKHAYFTEFRVAKDQRPRAEVARVAITRSALDVLEQGKQKQVLIQVVTDAGAEESAKARAQAFAESGRNPSSSYQIYGRLTAEPAATAHDLESGYNLAMRFGDYSAAKDASQKLFQKVKAEKNPSQRERAFAVLGTVRAMVRSGEYREAVEVGDAELGLYPKKQWPQKVYPSVKALMGLAYVRMGDLEKAAKMNDDLEAWWDAGIEPEVLEFREALRMAQVETALTAKPKDPVALADYGRALLDRGRYEEAVVKLKAALVEDPNGAAVRRDLAWAALHLGPKAEVTDLDQAVEEAKRAVRADDPKSPNKDFFGWNRYATLLYAKTVRDHGDAAFGEAYEPVMNALRQSVKLGRMGQEVNDGMNILLVGYLSGSQVSVAGYAYPEAAASFLMLDSLRRLRAKPDDHLSRHGLAQALLELGQPKLATRQLETVLKDHPEFTEATYLQARIALREEDDAGAQRLLETVLARNPRHPRANLDLAEVLTRLGDPAGAAERLAAHAKWYGGLAE
jgi:tetratricopeptide (TPR) repeat protein